MLLHFIVVNAWFFICLQTANAAARNHATANALPVTTADANVRQLLAQEAAAPNKSSDFLHETNVYN